ncbi:CpaF family protein [Janthinobacterium sp. MDT1-19]|uniref:CpaF family protein n=1 Tax=Janthinobacterium sp. MDT1-19 TaxID=1259339 RepID=UPI003F2308E4
MIDQKDKKSSVSWNLVMHYIQPIQHFFKDPTVTSIAINRFDCILVRKSGKWESTDATFGSEQNLVSCITQVIHGLGQTIDATLAPVADARLADGSRVNAVLYPTAHRGSNMTIRIFPKVRYTLPDLVGKGALSQEMLEFFQLAVKSKYTCLISGATGSGKTTLLNALANLTDDRDRIGVIEDTAELEISKPNIVMMEAAKKSIKEADGKDIVTMESLLVNTLRQELAVVVVGEVREPKAATALMLALNTGHEGVLSTIHANSPEKALRRLINMLLSTDTRIPYDAIKYEIYENFNLIIQAKNTHRHGQRIVGVSEIQNGALVSLFEWDYQAGVHKKMFDETTPPYLYEHARNNGILEH